MRRSKGWATLVAGIGLGFAGGAFQSNWPRTVAAGNDRVEGSVICTGSAGVNARSPLDGVWLYDAKTGKLLGTIVDRAAGRTVGFAEVDLAKEFGLSSPQAGQFLMTSGTIAQAQSALYVAETHSGKLAVYTMGPATGATSGVTILRHDMTSYRRESR